MIKQRSARCGAATAELAVLLPFLAFLCVLAVDWARLFHYTLTLNACARNGALYASDPVIAKQSPYLTLFDAAMGEAPSLTGAATVSSSSITDSAGNAAVVVTVSMPFNTITDFPGVPSSQTLSRSVQMRVAPLTTK